MTGLNSYTTDFKHNTEMQKLDLIVNQYLDVETDYALLLTGAWGTGKTYYFNKFIKPIIENKNTLKNEEKKYKLISISLFGLKSIGEIQTQILFSSYSIFNKKVSKTATTLLGTLAKGLLNITGVNAESIDTSLWSETLNEIKGFENLVICFDDIERKSSSLEISQFIGFVNLLIENHGTKIILIANESKIENFGECKEKVIGNTIEYIPDYKEIIHNITEESFSKNHVYAEFLSSQEELVLDVFNKSTKNLRTLKYALNQFGLIHSEIETLCKQEDKLFKNSKYAILKETLKFTLIISELYRAGEISFLEKKGLNSLDTYHLMIALQTINQQKDNTAEVSLIEKIHDKFYSFNDNYKYFDSIYSCITGGDVFDINILKNEVIELFRINEDGLYLPQYEVLESLERNSARILENSEYRFLTSRMLKHAYNGDYQNLSEYATVFELALRFNNIFNYSPDLLTQKLIKGIKRAKIKSKDPHTKNPYNYYGNIKEEDMYKEPKKRLYQFILNENQRILSYLKKEESKHLEEECKTDIYSFCQTFSSERVTTLNKIQPRVFYTTYIKSNNYTKHHLYWSLKETFEAQLGFLPCIKHFLVELKELFDKGSKQHVKRTLSGYHYCEIKKLFEDTLKEIQSTEIQQQNF